MNTRGKIATCLWFDSAAEEAAAFYTALIPDSCITSIYRPQANAPALLVEFTLADCAAAPSLFYADWVHDIPPQLSTLWGYRSRLLERASVSRCVDDARPFRHFFPPGAPDRD